jgi:hypothetical protein
MLGLPSPPDDEREYKFPKQWLDVLEDEDTAYWLYRQMNQNGFKFTLSSELPDWKDASKVCPPELYDRDVVILSLQTLSSEPKHGLRKFRVTRTLFNYGILDMPDCVSESERSSILDEENTCSN